MSISNDLPKNQLNNPSSRLVRVVVEWFLDFLTAPKHEGFWQNLEDQSNGLSDQLCQDMTAASYIDYLRSNIGEEQFRRIEEIAKRGLEFGAIEKYPHSIILLLGLARKHLSNNTALYDLGLRSYEYHKRSALNGQGGIRAQEIALETGIQLYRREKEIEDEKDIWQYLQLEFKYSNTLFERRKHFYQTDNSWELFNLTTDRWLRFPEERDDYNTLTKEGLDKYGALHPQLFDMPVPYDCADSLHIVEEFSKALRENKKATSIQKKLNRDELAKNLRIMQWDIFTRDLLTEQVERKLSYQSSLVENGLSGFPPKDFFKMIVEDSWKAHCHYFPVHSGSLRNRQRTEDHPCKAEDASRYMQKYRDGFLLLLNKATVYNPTSYDDVIEVFANRQTRKSISKALLIEDGELTFFSLLWLLRHAKASGEDPNVWQEDSSVKLLVGFLPNQKEEYDSWWSRKNLASLAQACGLLVPSHHGNYILTRRWRSLLRWLHRQQKMVVEFANEQDGASLKGNQINESLPIKKIASVKSSGTPEHQFALALENFFTSLELKEFLASAQVFPDEITIEAFARNCIGPLTKLMNALLLISPNSPNDAADEPWPNRDITIFRLCRVGFLPLEYLFRAYQPYELHLLMLAMSFTKTELVEQKSAPVSLAFATIAGSLPPHVPRGMFVNIKDDYRKSNSCDSEYRVKALEWLAPYWTLFTALAAELSTGKVQRASKQIGVEEILNAFSHEVGKVEGYIFSSFFKKMEDVFSIEGHSKAPGPDLGIMDKWDDPAGLIKPSPTASGIADWRVCPMPSTLNSLYKLYAIWIGSKLTLTDFGIDPNGYLENLVEQIKPMAIEMAVARQRVDDMNMINSLEAAQQTEKITCEKISAAAHIVSEFTSSAKRLKLNKESDNTDTYLKIFLVRALLAALSNAVQHTPSGGQVDVIVKMDKNYVVVKIENPAVAASPDSAEDIAGSSQLITKTKFGLGSKAVMQTCAKQLGGTADLNRRDGDTRYYSTITFPLPEAGEDNRKPWLTLELK